MGIGQHRQAEHPGEIGCAQAGCRECLERCLSSKRHWCENLDVYQRPALSHCLLPRFRPTLQVTQRHPGDYG